jgi:hypothetical protein
MEILACCVGCPFCRYSSGGKGHSGILVRTKGDLGKEAIFQVQSALEESRKREAKELKHILRWGLPLGLLRSSKKSNLAT